MKNARGFISVLLTVIMLFGLSLGMVTMKACDSSSDDKFNRAIAALNTAPALIASFTNATVEERTKLEGYFADAVSALRAYRQFKTDENWGAFISVLANIASNQISDSTGQARIQAIVGLVKIILGVPDQALELARRGGVVDITQPNLKSINEADIQRLEQLMKPLQ